jgi:hypothetical protein
MKNVIHLILYSLMYLPVLSKLPLLKEIFSDNYFFTKANAL